jgi:hypothetical protein
MGVTIICKQEYVMMGGTWVDNILCPSDVIRSVIESSQMVAVNAVVLEKY